MDSNELEMDLKAQDGTIWESENEQEDQLTENNHKMLKRMREEKIPWAESYQGELYPIEKDQFPM